MKRKLTVMTLLALIIAAAAITTALAATTNSTPRVRIALSTPEETDLAVDGVPDARVEILDMIRTAESTLDIAQFYTAGDTRSNDATGPVLGEIIDAMDAAGKRGVRIRFLLSEAMADEDTAVKVRLRAIPRLQLRIIDLDTLTQGILHAKYWIRDREELYIGSQNFDWRSFTQIHEVGARVRDRGIVSDLGRIFETDWEIARTHKLPAEPRGQRRPVPNRRGQAIELVASPPQMNPPGIRSGLEGLTGLLASAKKEVRMQVLSYNTVKRRQYWGAIDNAIRSAATRGVKVKMMVSHWNTDTPAIDHLKSLSLLPNVQLRIVTIPEHSTGFLPYARVIHSKYIVVDADTIWIGTSNWSRSYFDSDRNVELIIADQVHAATGARIFDKLWSSPYAEPIDVARKYPSPRRG